jgi:ABC-2 type transport system permease protein
MATQQYFEYRYSFISNMIFAYIPFLINLLLWFAIFKSNKNAQFGFSLQEMISYFYIILIVDNLISSGIEWNIARDIKSGDLNQYLIKPISFIKYRFFISLPKVFIFLIIGSIPIIALGFFLKNYLVITFSLKNICYFTLSLIIGYTINFFLSFLLSLTSFFLNETGNLFVAIDFLKGIVTGKIIPLSIIPKAIYSIIVFTPFQFIGYFSSIIMINRFTEFEIIKNIFISLIWIAILYILSVLLWKKGLKKYSSFGG